MAVGMNCNFGFQEAVDGVSMLPFAETSRGHDGKYILTAESSVYLSIF